MVDSGIKCTQECVEAFNNLGSNKKYRYIILGFNEDLTQVQFMDHGKKDASFEEMLSKIPKNEVRFIFYDVNFKTKEGHDRNRVVYAVWSHDDYAEKKQKMLASSTSNEVAKRCHGFYKKIEAHDYSTLTLDHFVESVSSKFD